MPDTLSLFDVLATAFRAFNRLRWSRLLICNLRRMILFPLSLQAISRSEQSFLTSVNNCLLNAFRMICRAFLRTYEQRSGEFIAAI